MRPGTPRLLRGINDRAALELLLEHGPLSRGRLGELTGLSKPTVAQLLGRLESAGLVLATGTSATGPGPAAQLYEVDPGAGHVGALDVTPSRIRAAVADVTGRVVGRAELPTPRRAGSSAAADVGEALDRALAEPGLRRCDLTHVAVGTPGGIDPGTGRLRYARHLPGWHGPGIGDALHRALAVPVSLANDVNLAAVAEQHAGRAAGVADFVLLWADEGLGAAIVTDGRLHAGATGGAGEVGFLPLPGAPVVRQVRRANTGGFQELAGGKQVVALARGLGLRTARPDTAVRAALETPGAGDRLLAELAARFALGIAAVVAVLDPALVLLAGGVMSAGGTRLRDLIAAELAPLTASSPTVALASVTDDPVLTGALHTALAVARDQLFDTLRDSAPVSPLDLEVGP